MGAIGLPYTNVIGKSVRTMTDHLNMRYTEWLPLDVKKNQVNWDHVIAAELYDLTKDPEQTANVVDESEYGAVVAKMRDHLRNEWGGALQVETTKKALFGGAQVETTKKATPDALGVSYEKVMILMDEGKEGNNEFDVLDYKLYCLLFAFAIIFGVFARCKRYIVR